MKKTAFILIFVMLFSLLTFNLTYANDEIKVFIDGRQLSFTQPPVIVNGRTLVPMRAIFEALGAEVSWDNDTRTARGTTKGVDVCLTIDSPTMKRNYVDAPLDVAATIINNSTMIPLRVVSECFGMDVQWNGDTKTVTITDLNTIKRLDIDKLFYYYGEVKDGKPFGYGALYSTETNELLKIGYFEGEVLKEGASFSSGGYIMMGKFDEQGRSHGYCYIHFANGEEYKGNFTHGKKEGYGIYCWTNGSRYEGNWSDGVINGQGVCYYADGSRYEGNWSDGAINGQGVCYYADGSRYEGNWSDNTKSGYGICYYADGSRYEGNWSDDTINGQGVCYYADGSRYEGNWSDGAINGQGIYYYADGNRYEGNWSNGAINGQGIFYCTKGDRYEGNFVNGKLHGYGTLYYANGNKHEGNWVNGVLYI